MTRHIRFEKIEDVNSPDLALHADRQTIPIDVSWTSIIDQSSLITRDPFAHSEGQTPADHRDIFRAFNVLAREFH